MTHRTRARFQLPWRCAVVLALALAAMPLAMASSEDAPTPSGPAAIIAPAAPVVSDEQAFPTPRQKLKDYAVRVAGPGRLAGAAFSAAFSQWKNQPEEWGQGWDAYGHRVGHRLAYNGVRQTISLGVSFAFREDNRYFKANDSIGRRILHALGGPFVARRPDGSRAVSVSSLAGFAGASAISSTWGPPGWKGGRNIAFDTGISLAGSAAYNLIAEFLPKRHR